MSNAKILLEKLKDLFMFRDGGDIDNYITPPSVTSGSILWGILLRSCLLILLTLTIIFISEKREIAWLGVFIFWIVVAYPAYRQHNILTHRLESLKEETLCGKCKYFVKESQLCSALDEHISKDNIPCEGSMWEANPDIFYN